MAWYYIHHGDEIVKSAESLEQAQAYMSGYGTSPEYSIMASNGAIVYQDGQQRYPETRNGWVTLRKITSSMFCARLMYHPNDFSTEKQWRCRGIDPLMAWYRCEMPGQMIDIIEEMGLVSAEAAEAVICQWSERTTAEQTPQRRAWVGQWSCAEQATRKAFGQAAAGLALRACHDAEWKSAEHALRNCPPNDDRLIAAIKTAMDVYQDTRRKQLNTVRALVAPRQLLEAIHQD